MTPEAMTELIRDYYNAYEISDRTIVEKLLSDDFTFCSPLDDNIDRTTFLAKCWPFHEQLHRFDLEQVAFDRNHALVRYQAHLLDGGHFRNVEHHELTDGRITHIDVYFGAPGGTD